MELLAVIITLSVIFGLPRVRSFSQARHEVGVHSVEATSCSNTGGGVHKCTKCMRPDSGKEDGGNPVHKQFKYLFDSVSKNDSRKIQQYANVLKDVQEKDAQAYNEMNAVMRAAKLKRVVKSSSATQTVRKRSNAYNDEKEQFVDAMLKLRTTKMMHSTPVSHDYDAMQVKVLPALTDNFMYLLIDKESREAAVVDPVDIKLALRAAEAAKVNITTILTTHYHADHSGGNVDLVKRLNNSVRVVGGSKRIPALNFNVSHNDEFTLGSLTVKSLYTPCHTTDHFCYYVTSPNAKHPVVFTGDTLFIAGCGRFMEGTAAQMDKALNQTLGGLPDDTRVYCGHEYTRRNLEFAEEVEPRNDKTKEMLYHVSRNRHAKLPSVPSTIGDEKEINPFMRLHTSGVQRFAQKTDRIEIMEVLRTAKDKF